MNLLGQYRRELQEKPTAKGHEIPVRELLDRAFRYAADGHVDAAIEEAFHAGAYHEKFRASHQGVRGRGRQNGETDQRRIKAQSLFHELKGRYAGGKKLRELYAEVGKTMKPPAGPRTVQRYVTGK